MEDSHHKLSSTDPSLKFESSENLYLKEPKEQVLEVDEREKEESI